MRNFTETREKAIKRTRQLVCYFAEFMLEEEEMCFMVNPLKFFDNYTTKKNKEKA